MAGALMLAACGGSDGGTADEAPSAAPAGAGDTSSDAPVDTEKPDADSSGTTPSDASNADSAGADSATDTPTDTGTANAASAGDSSIGESSGGGDAADIAWPDEACSADSSPTALDNAAAPPTGVAIRAISATDSLLPDLAVRRINCGGGWINLRNELPAAQPLLVWFWAPH